MVTVVYLLYLLVASLGPTALDGKGYCSFPDYIWATESDGSRRLWITETSYLENSYSWAGQKEITAKETELIVRHRTEAKCVPGSTHIPGCYRKELMYRIICLSNEVGNKFRVQQKGNNFTGFSCLSFDKINDNIIQVLMANPKAVNEDKLCLDEEMKRSPWPWLRPNPKTWTGCPLQGGFDFKLFKPDRKREELCPRVWRPSRLESECMMGEGILFSFPSKKCNPFIDTPEELQVQCWSHWPQGEHNIVLLAKEGEMPQYSLKLPRNLNLQEKVDKLEGALYLSPIVPPTKDDHTFSHSSAYSHYYLEMKRSDSHVCADESERCKDFAAQGKCINRALHKYANHCKFSCGLCDFAPSEEHECTFPAQYLGQWMIFDGRNKKNATIHTDKIYFSHLGSFICKSKHWERDHFKLLSVFQNGCRPRYTCAHLVKSPHTENAMFFQLSRSKLSDESFDMCEFQDDPAPLGDRIRSRQLKLMLAERTIDWGVCGLNGEVRINSSNLQNSRSCFGTISDWDTQMCHTRSSLRLTLDNCDGIRTSEFKCVGSMKIDANNRILITQKEDKPYSCWDIVYKPRKSYSDAWHEAHQRRTMNCAMDDFIFPQLTFHDKYKLSLDPLDSRVRQTCRGGERSVIYPPWTPSRPSNHIYQSPTPRSSVLLTDNHYNKVPPQNRIEEQRSGSKSLSTFNVHFTMSMPMAFCFVLVHISSQPQTCALLLINR